MSTGLTSAPVLSTPDEHILSEDPTNIQPAVHTPVSELHTRYEIHRTAAELISGGWTCIALQFPDSLLQDAPRVVELLQHELNKTPIRNNSTSTDDIEPINVEAALRNTTLTSNKPKSRRLYILGDTSYGACCVDEIAAEHISAEVVVHYGRACLSPTSRLPVVYVFTQQELDHDHVIETFKTTYPDSEAKIILTSDVMFSSHLSELHSRLRQQEMYINLYTPDIIHSPLSLIPNRTLPEGVSDDEDALRQYVVFHISNPPTALLLTLSSRVGDITIFPTERTSSVSVSSNTTSILRRRYGLVTSLSTASIFGILINTLSVSNYQSVAANIATQIRAVGKKSYTFVVGKINAAKVANFAEVDGWIVVGCWESSLVEGDAFWKPVITPFELELVLRGDKSRVWTGEWNGSFTSWLETRPPPLAASDVDTHQNDTAAGDGASDDESMPPEFDLRTGQYISHSRPLGKTTRSINTDSKATTALSKRVKGDIAIIGKEVSPGAEFLQTQRTWKGLGSDIQIEYDENGNESMAGTLMEQGRSGVARGYVNERSNES